MTIYLFLHREEQWSTSNHDLLIVLASKPESRALVLPHPSVPVAVQTI